MVGFLSFPGVPFGQRLRDRENVHQLNSTRTEQLLIFRHEFQFHLQVVLCLFGCEDPLPHPDLCGSHRSIRQGWTVSAAPGGADTGLLRLSLTGLL